MNSYVVYFLAGDCIEKMFGPYQTASKARKMVFENIKQLSDKVESKWTINSSSFDDVEHFEIKDKKTNETYCKYRIFKLCEF